MMNNKKGGAGAIVILVLILMIASAVGGAYGYSVFDGKMAVRDAKKAVEDVDISDYDEPEQILIKGYIDDATKDLDNAKTRKEVYEILGDFLSDVEKVQTKNEKALEEALKAAEEAKQQANNNNNNNNNSSNTGNSGNDQSTYGSDDDPEGGSYKSNQLNEGSDGTETSGGNSILDSLLGSMKGSN